MYRPWRLSSAGYLTGATELLPPIATDSRAHAACQAQPVIHD